MPTKRNKAGQQQNYVPQGNGDASGEYANNQSGSNVHFTSFKKPESSAQQKSFGSFKKANVEPQQKPQTPLQQPKQEQKPAQWNAKYGIMFLGDINGDKVASFQKSEWSNYYTAKYRDNTGRKRTATFKKQDDAMKWAEEQYNRGITEVTPEKAKEIEGRYGMEETIYEKEGRQKIPVGKTIHTGLSSTEDYKIINNIIGQLTDGIWENTREGRTYGGNLKVNRSDDGEVILETDIEASNSPYKKMNPQQVMSYLAKKSKEVVDREVKDGSSAKWDQNDKTQLDYLEGSAGNVFKVYNHFMKGSSQQTTKPSNSITKSAKPTSNMSFKNDTDLKNKQLEIILKNNPMKDDYHTGIRSVKDIKTFAEVIDDEESFVYGDFSREDAKTALKKGKVKVYSSKPITQGGFVSTSKNMARDYAGGGKIYEQEVDLGSVAWINGDEGQFANTKK